MSTTSAKLGFSKANFLATIPGFIFCLGISSETMLWPRLLIITLAAVSFSAFSLRNPSFIYGALYRFVGFAFFTVIGWSYQALTLTPTNADINTFFLIFGPLVVLGTFAMIFIVQVRDENSLENLAENGAYFSNFLFDINTFRKALQRAALALLALIIALNAVDETFNSSLLDSFRGWIAAPFAFFFAYLMFTNIVADWLLKPLRMVDRWMQRSILARAMTVEKHIAQHADAWLLMSILFVCYILIFMSLYYGVDQIFDTPQFEGSSDNIDYAQAFHIAASIGQAELAPISGSIAGFINSLQYIALFGMMSAVVSAIQGSTRSTSRLRTEKSDERRKWIQEQWSNKSRSR